MVKSFKTRIYPTQKQIEYFNNAFGIRRWTWNWGLEIYMLSLNDNKPKSYQDLQKELNNTLVKQKDYEWLTKVNSMVRQEVFKDLGVSIKRYHDEQYKTRTFNKTISINKYKPKFKSKKYTTNSFRYNSKGNPVKPISKHYFTLTVVRGVKPLKIKTKESLMFLKDCRFCTITISEKAGKYYVSITYERNNRKKKRKNNYKVGIDMGIKTPMTCVFMNDKGKKKDKKFNIPSSLYKQEKKTERIQRMLSRKEKDSKNRDKIKKRLQKSYIREVNIKKDFREKLTTFLARNCSVIHIETYSHKSGLNIKCGRALSRVSGYELVERLKDKCDEYKTKLKFIPSFTPTTQTCSSCGYKHSNETNDKIQLSQRSFVCPQCNTKHDRDVNAAVNILNYQF